MSRSVGALSVRPLGLLAPPLLAGLVACSSATPPVATQPVPTTPPAVTQPAPASTATVRGQLIVPSAFLPSGTSLADVYSKTRIWLYDASNAAIKSAAVDSAGNYTLIVPAGMSGQRLVAVIGSGSAAVSFETSMVPLAASGNARLDITLQSTVDNQYANDPVLKANFDSAATAIWNKAFADQNIAPIDPSLIPANAMLLVGPDLSGDPSNSLLSSQALKPGLVKQNFFNALGNVFVGVVNGVANAAKEVISFVVNGLKDAIAKVVTPQEPRLIVDFDNTAKQLVLTGIGGRVISNDGGSLISQDGGGLISQDGGGLISQDGGGIVASGGGNVISNDGGSFTGGGITSSALKAQATVFITRPVGGVARIMRPGERCVSDPYQVTCVFVSNEFIKKYGPKVVAAASEAVMQDANQLTQDALGIYLDPARLQEAILNALQTLVSTTAPTTPPTSVVVSPARPSNQKPLASIALRAGSGGSGAFPYTETFDASASRDPDGSVSFYEWNFGDGSPLLRLAASNGKTVSHTYTRAGNFTVTLTVYDNVGGQSDPARQPITVFTKTALPIIGDPSTDALTLSAPTGGSATATVQYSNLGSGSLNADANPGSGWLSVISNTPKPLAPGETATVTLKATCDRRPGVLETDLKITANDSRIPSPKPVQVTLYCRGALPVIGAPSPNIIIMTGSAGTPGTGNFKFTNTGGGVLNADINPGSGWLRVISNTPKPLNPGDTATVELQGICPAAEASSTLHTNVIITANDSRIPPPDPVNVALHCTAPTAAALGLGITTVGGQSVPPSGTVAHPVSGTISVSGYVQAGASPVHKVRLFLVGNPTPIAGRAVSVDAGVRQDNIGEADLDTKSLSNGTYTFFVRATDDSGAVADSAPVTVSVDNPAPMPTQQPASTEIRQIGLMPVSPGEAPVVVSGNVNVITRLYGGSQGYNGYVYLCFERSGSNNTPVAVQSINVQPNGVGDFGYTWDTRSVPNTPSNSGQDSLFLSGSRMCDDISNPATTSLIGVRVSN